MSADNTFLKSIRESAGIRLSVLFGSFFILLLISSLLAFLINKLPIGDARDHALTISALQCLLAFCVPAFLVAKFSNYNWADWLKLTRLPKLQAVVALLIVYVVSMPAMEWIIELNANFHLPDSMAPLEATLREWETNAENTTKVLLETNGFWSLICGVLVIGVLTGFSEELFFRGGFQGILTRTPMNKDLAVWMSGLLFSVMHFQFFGFIPRLLMGVFFGYLLVWSQSIWLPVLAHAINNSMVVIVSAITGNTSQGLWENGESSLIMGNMWGVVGSILLTTLFLWFFRDMFKTGKIKETWQRNQLPPATER